MPTNRIKRYRRRHEAEELMLPLVEHLVNGRPAKLTSSVSWCGGFTHKDWMRQTWEDYREAIMSWFAEYHPGAVPFAAYLFGDVPNPGGPTCKGAHFETTPEREICETCGLFEGGAGYWPGTVGCRAHHQHLAWPGLGAEVDVQKLLEFLT